MKVIYLASYKAKLTYKNVIYQDINGKRDIAGDMMDVNLESYDILIATPPCNFYSKARGNRKPSLYAIKTKHLLPNILDKFQKTGKPFIVENVINKPRMRHIINNFNGFYYEHGRHSYFTNVMINFTNIEQKQDFKGGGYYIGDKTDRQGGVNVSKVLDYFIDYVAENNFRKEEKNATNI